MTRLVLLQYLRLGAVCFFAFSHVFADDAPSCHSDESSGNTIHTRLHGGTVLLANEIAVDSIGNVYTLSLSDNAVSKIFSNGTTISHWFPPIDNPGALLIDSNDRVLVFYPTYYSIRDSDDSSILQTIDYPLAGELVSVLFDSNENIFLIRRTTTDTLVTKINGTQVDHPWATISSTHWYMKSEIDNLDNLYILTESNPQKIYKISPQRNINVHFQGSNYNFFSDIAIDTAKNIYAPITNTGEILKILANGSVNTNWAVTGRNPAAIAFDQDNNLYTANEYDRTVTKILPNGNAVQYGGRTGPSPNRIAIDNDNNVYTLNKVSLYRDSHENTVTKISVSDCTIRDSPPSPSSDDDTKTLAIGLGVGIPVGLLLIGGGIYYYRKRKSTPPELAINLM